MFVKKMKEHFWYTRYVPELFRCCLHIILKLLTLRTSDLNATSYGLQNVFYSLLYNNPIFVVVFLFYAVKI